MPKPPSLPGARPLMAAKKLSMLVYGDPAIGKTVLVGSGEGRTLILRPPMDHTDSIRDPGGEIEERVINDWASMDDAYMHLRQMDAGTYDWVWLDSISLVQDTGLDDIWEQIIEEKPHRKQFGLDKGDYGVNMQRLARWVRHMVALAKDEGLFNFGITAHPRELTPTENPEDAEMLMPYVQGKNMSPKICGYMNVVAYYEIAEIGGKPKRVLRFDKTEDYYAKDQFTAFDRGRLIDPTMPKVEAAIAANRPSTKARKRTTTRRAGARRGGTK